MINRPRHYRASRVELESYERSTTDKRMGGKAMPVSFSGIFALRDGVSEEEFLPTLHAFFQHFIDIGFATTYRIMRREALDGFGNTLPPFTYRGELIYPDLEREQAAYEYVKQRGEQVHSLHVAMNSLVKPAADFFLETRIA